MPRDLIFVHQYFAPELAGSAQQLTDLTLALRERGHSVKVVTAQPSYSSKDKLPRTENIKGVAVYRVFKIQSSRDTKVGRILSAVSFLVAAWIKLFQMSSKALLIIGSDPPLLSLLGWFFKKWRREPYTLIISDAYPEIAVALGEIKPGSWMARFLEWANRLAYCEADAIVVLGEKMEATLREKYFHGKNGRTIRVIHNWADGDRIRPLPKSENPFCRSYNLVDTLTLLFSGNMGKIYDFEAVLALAACFKTNPTVRFLFIGGGPQKKWIADEALSRGLKNVLVLPYQSVETLPFSLASGDLALIPLKSEAVGLCVPGKFYYALAAGIPLLVMAPRESEAAQIVLENDCGWVIPGSGREEAAGLLKRLVQDPFLLDEKRKKARDCFDSKFQKERAVREYYELYSGIEQTRR